MSESEILGQVFNVQRYCVHDGPGIRTVVFLKGCPLACQWCSNPESQSLHPSVGFNSTRCIGEKDGYPCLQACPQEVLQLDREGTGLPVFLKRHQCDICQNMPCTEACVSGALNVYGKPWRVSDLVDSVEKESVFYQEEGGLTLSGGEPLFQHEFALALLREAKHRHIHCVIESCAQTTWEIFAEALSMLDAVIIDIKHMDTDAHKAGTGFGNELILSNIRRMAECFPDKDVLIRTPIIPSFNDTEEAIGEIAKYVRSFRNFRYELLPYHKLGTQKYQYLGRTYTLGNVDLSKRRELELRNLAQSIVGEDRFETV